MKFNSSYIIIVGIIFPRDITHFYLVSNSDGCNWKKKHAIVFVHTALPVIHKLEKKLNCFSWKKLMGLN